MTDIVPNEELDPVPGGDHILLVAAIDAALTKWREEGLIKEEEPTDQVVLYRVYDTPEQRLDPRALDLRFTTAAGVQQRMRFELADL